MKNHLKSVRIYMKKINLRSEEGAATVLEAMIVYPIVLLAVVFLVFMGFINVQKGFMQHCADELSTYIAKVIRYPGYDKLQNSFMDEDNSPITIAEMNTAAKQIEPYRYLFNLGKDYSQSGSSSSDVIPDNAKKIVVDYLKKHGFLKAEPGTAPQPKTNLGSKAVSEQSGGRRCTISANTSRVVVYLGQNFIFADFFRMIGIGGKKVAITGQSTAYVCDSVEIMRVTDCAFDAANFLLGKLGVDLSNVKEALAKFTGNS